MFYLGIDQHAKQLTVCVLDETGTVVLRRQVSTHPERVESFFESIVEMSSEEGGWMVILEVCGFNDWLLRFLSEKQCEEIVVIQPDCTSRRKTDRRDAAALAELLWVNRIRLRAGVRVQGVRRVFVPDAWDHKNRQLTSLRMRLGWQRTRTINQIKHLLNKHNLCHQQPTKGFQTKAVQRWLKALELDNIDRLEMDQLLARWEQLEPQLLEVERLIHQRFEHDAQAQRVGTISGCGPYTALAIASRIGPIERFSSARSLTNYWGLTPTCHSSGESSRQGHISKEGSSIVRFLLGQLVLHVLRSDSGLKAWYQNVKKRRGSKIARVGVMRKLAASIWFMVRYDEPYVPVNDRPHKRFARTRLEPCQN